MALIRFLMPSMTAGLAGSVPARDVQGVEVDQAGASGAPREHCPARGAHRRRQRAGVDHGGTARGGRKYGTAHVKRAYGDWTAPNLRGWKDQLLAQSIQQFAYTTGKNATDAAVVIDAMDLLYSGRFNSRIAAP
jgi:hypothetical protein